MPRPQTKEALIFQADENFTKLLQYIDSMPEEALNTEFDFSDDPGKKELHWRRDRNLRDVLVHLYEWHQLLLKWVDSNLSGRKANFLPEPYNWKTYGEMNIEIWQKHQKTPLSEAKALVKGSHEEALELVKSFSDEALFTKQHFDWTGSTTLGSYCISAMPSHYDWAMKKLRAHVKKISK